MEEKPLRYALIIAVVTGFLGVCGWFLFKWLMTENSIPNSALKVVAPLVGC